MVFDYVCVFLKLIKKRSKLDKLLFFGIIYYDNFVFKNGYRLFLSIYVVCENYLNLCLGL